MKPYDCVKLVLQLQRLTSNAYAKAKGVKKNIQLLWAAYNQYSLFFSFPLPIKCTWAGIELVKCWNVNDELGKSFNFTSISLAGFWSKIVSMKSGQNYLQVVSGAKIYTVLINIFQLFLNLFLFMFFQSWVPLYLVSPEWLCFLLLVSYVYLCDLQHTMKSHQSPNNSSIRRRT